MRVSLPVAVIFLSAVLLFPFCAFAQDLDAGTVAAVVDAGVPVVAAPVAPAVDYLGPVFQGLVGLAGVVLTFLMAVLGRFFVGLSQRSAVGAVVNKLWIVIQSAVAHAETELRPKFQKALEDGKLTPEEGAALKAEVIVLVKASAGPLMRDLIKAFGEGAIPTLLSGLVERAVSGLSQPTPTVQAPNPNP